MTDQRTSDQPPFCTEAIEAATKALAAQAPPPSDQYDCNVHGRGPCICLGARYWMDLALSYADQIVTLALEAEQLDKRLLAVRNRFDPLNESGLFSIADVASVAPFTV